MGVLRGSDPKLAKKVIMLSAHLDHLGVSENTPAGGDAIFNGADDDASGCVAVLELARVLASGQRPKRTIYFICFGSEERGGYGAQYFVAHSPVPLSDIVADITFEMLGRPDSKVPPNTLWLTGYERSNVGSGVGKAWRTTGYRSTSRGAVLSTVGQLHSRTSRRGGTHGLEFWFAR